MHRKRGGTKGFNKRARKTAAVNRSSPPRGGYRM